MSYTDKLKRKFVETNEESELYFLVKYESDCDDDGEFSVVKASQLKLSKTDLDKGKIKHKNQTYEVTILKRGTKSYVDGKASKFQKKQSLDTDVGQKLTVIGMCVFILTLISKKYFRKLNKGNETDQAEEDYVMPAQVTKRPKSKPILYLGLKITIYKIKHHFLVLDSLISSCDDSDGAATPSKHIKSKKSKTSSYFINHLLKVIFNYKKVKLFFQRHQSTMKMNQMKQLQVSKAKVRNLKLVQKYFINHLLKIIFN